MAVVGLVVVVAALLVERAFSSKEHAAQMKRMLNMVAARSTPELALLNKIDEAPASKDPQAAREIIHPIGA